MKFLKSPVINDEAISSDGIKSYDLPVLPMSHLVLTVKGLNVTDEATILQLCNYITKISVNHLGSDIANYSMLDLLALNFYLLRRHPFASNPIATDDAVRSISLLIPFGRRLYDHTECYKATRRGELKIDLTVDIAHTNADGLILQLEAVQLPEASPSQYLKCVTSNFTPASTGEDKVPIPLGSRLAGILLWATTVPATTSWTATIEDLELLIDESEKYYTKSYWETLHGAGIERAVDLQFADVNTAVTVLSNHVFMDFDPLMDNSFLLDTFGAKSAELNINFGDTNPIRVLPVQIRNF